MVVGLEQRSKCGHPTLARFSSLGPHGHHTLAPPTPTKASAILTCSCSPTTGLLRTSRMPCASASSMGAAHMGRVAGVR